MKVPEDILNVIKEIRMGEFMIIYILRHGQTVNNEKHILQGQTNTELNDTGKTQAAEVRKLLETKEIAFDRIYCSPLIRTMQTGEIATGRSREDFIIDKRIIEIGLGTWEERPFASLTEVEVEGFMRPTSEDLHPEGGESFRQVIDRVSEFYEDLKKTENDDTVLVVSHGCAIHAMLSYFLDKSISEFWKPWLDNCALVRVELQNGKYTVEEKYR